MVKEREFILDFSLCGLCIIELRNLLECAERKGKASLRIFRDRGLNHLEVLK